MTREDYRLLAFGLRSAKLDIGTKMIFANVLMRILKKDNPQFSEVTFWRNAGLWALDC